MTRATIRVMDRLFDRSPYAGFDPSPWPDDIQGWRSEHPVLLNAIDRLRPARVLEIGSWKGRSALYMARHLRDLGLACEIVCVDTWLGSAEHWLRRQRGWYESLRIAHGVPRLYYTFLANVVRAGLQDWITPFPTTSQTATKVLAELGVRFDLCYVDAAHEYDPVSQDLAACWELLDDPGILIGDDYDWAEVRRAVDDFAARRGLSVSDDREKFVVMKGGPIAPLLFGDAANLSGG